MTTKTIQVRRVREEVHRELSRRARLHRKTLTAYVDDILEREVAIPDQSEILARLDAREPLRLDISAAELVKLAREDMRWPTA